MAHDRPRPRALIVEDEAPIRELLRLHLDLGGFALDEAGDGRRGLDLARSTAFTNRARCAGVALRRATRLSQMSTAASSDESAILAANIPSIPYRKTPRRGIPKMNEHWEETSKPSQMMREILAR